MMTELRVYRTRCRNRFRLVSSLPELEISVTCRRHRVNNSEPTDEITPDQMFRYQTDG